MTRHSITHRILQATAAIAALTFPISPALAEDTPVKDALRRNLHREILISENAELRQEGGWFSPDIHLHRKAGFSYTHHLKLGKRPLVFRIKGPVMRKQKALGLAFKIRF